MAEWITRTALPAGLCLEPVSPVFIDALVARIRPSDAQEIHATVGHRQYASALWLSALGSTAVTGISTESGPAAVLGVGRTLLSGAATPWLIATTEADRQGRAFITLGRSYTAAMLSEYRALENHVDARNTRSIRWLQRLGYTFSAPQPYGALGLPFLKFRKEA